MDKQYLNDEFDRFFEFPTEDKSQVSSISAKLFAEHIAYPIEQELAAAKAEIELCNTTLRLNSDMYLEDLAARDLVIKQMRVVLVEMSRQCVSDWPALREALALQPTQEALDAYVQRAKEEVRDKCAAKCDEAFADNIFTTHDAAIIGMATTKCAEAIRGMKQ